MTVDAPDQHQMRAGALDHLCVELVPPTLYNSVAAVLYRVGDNDFNPLDTVRPFTEALREALTERLIPRQRSVRRRYIAAVVNDGEEATALPPHLRPGLVLTMRMSLFLAGGVLFENMDAFGPDPVHRAAAIGWLAERSGVPFGHHALPELDDPRLALEPVGTFTIGYLRPNIRYLEPDRLHEAVREWNRDARHLVPTTEGDREQATAEMLAEAVSTHGWNPADMTFFEPTTTSAVVEDLSAASAAEMARRLRQRGASTSRVVDTLQLLGYLNPSGNRVWNRDILTGVERG